MFEDIRYARVCYKQGSIKGLNTVASGRGQRNYRGVHFPMPVRVRVRNGIVSIYYFYTIWLKYIACIPIKQSRNPTI